MYILEYCNDPEHADLKDGHRNFDDYFPLEFNNALNALDRFLYLTDMHRIIVSCASDFLHLQGGEEVEFWQINKYFLNTVSCRRGDVIGNSGDGPDLFASREIAFFINEPLSKTDQTKLAMCS